MKFLPMAAFVAAVLTCSAFTHAGDVYINGQLGIAEFEFDDDDDLFSAIALGWSGSKNFAAEVAYNDYGKYIKRGIDDDPIDSNFKQTHEIYSIAVTGIGKMNITESFYLTGKIGFDFWGLDITTDRTYGSFKQDESGTDLFMGFGLIYDLSTLTSFTKGVAFSFEYQMHDFDKIDVDVWAGGLSYTF